MNLKAIILVVAATLLVATQAGTVNGTNTNATNSGTSTTQAAAVTSKKPAATSGAPQTDPPPPSTDAPAPDVPPADSESTTGAPDSATSYHYALGAAVVMLGAAF